MEAPFHPYKEQPNDFGKFIWITGPSGLAKSKAAQLLARSAGYVYYEGDCFSFDVYAAKPSKALVSQKSLQGDGLNERNSQQG